MGLKRLSSVNIHTSHISEHEQKLAVISEVQQKKVCTVIKEEKEDLCMKAKYLHDSAKV